MNKIVKTIAILFFVTTVLSCSEANKNGDSLPPLKIEIPAELQGNAEVVTFIKDSEEAINIYTQSGEELAEKLKPYVGKKEAELSMMDKVKMLGALGQFTANFGQVAIKYGEMVEKTKVIEKGLSEEQTAALATVLDAFKNRMQELESKYKDINKSENK
jgi:hypothetical protein